MKLSFRFSALLSAVIFACAAARLLAGDAPGSKDPALLKRMEGSEIIWYKKLAFDAMTIALERIEWDYSSDKFKPTKKENTEGARTILYYKLPGETSTLEAVRQYETALKPDGFETLFTAENDKLDDGYNRFVSEIFPTAKKTDQLQYLHEFNKDEQRYLVLKGKGKAGNAVYVSLYAFQLNDVSTGFAELVEKHKLAKGQTVLRVDLLETKAMTERMTVVKADEITQSIEKTGRVAIYGVNFDTDKAEIKPESAEALTEMAKAVKAAAPGRKFLIVGHTDNTGDYGRNQTLSQKRAAAVTAELSQRYGIPAASLIPVGVGMAAPVAPNTDEAGRAKNRRVEIVAM